MEKKFVIQKSNSSMYVCCNHIGNPEFCLFPNIEDTINGAKKMDYETAHDVAMLLQSLGIFAVPVNLHDLIPA